MSFSLYEKFLKSDFNSEEIINEKNHLDFFSNTRDVIQLINKTVMNDPGYKDRSYHSVAKIVDNFGPRLWGSQPLEDAIDELYQMMQADGFQNVQKERIDDVPVWIRGEEYLIMTKPRSVPTKIPMIGLGLSTNGNITAEIVMLSSLEELKTKNVTGKIAFLNCKWDGSYFTTVACRSQGPAESAKHGAVGVVIRSITPVSVETPHTGTTYYQEGVEKIPGCAVSIETADMFERMINRGSTVELNLFMSAHFLPETTTSYNLVGEIVGSEYPDEIILMGGHLDSWDTGPQTGSNDDLAGFMVCYEAVRTLIKLGIRPKRTIRVIGWSGEEMGFDNKGANVYARTHKDELAKHVVAFESDEGTTNIWGFGFTGSDRAFSIVNMISTQLLGDYKMGDLNNNDGVMVDTTPLSQAGVPVMRNLVNETLDNREYFLVHHTAGDSVSILNPHDMNRNVVGIASMFYAIANLPDALPR